MAYKIIWSPEAEDTFDCILEYLEKNWTRKEIIKFIKETERTIEFLKQNPYLFRASEKENIHEVLISKQNLLLYQVSSKDRKVELLGFWVTKKNPKGKLNLH